MRQSPSATSLVLGRIRKGAFAAACLLLMCACGNQGGELTEKQRMLLEGDTLRRADFRGADLRDVDLRGKDLREADLSRANLKGVSLQASDLRRAILV